MNCILPLPEYLRECFSYDSETGELRWRVRPRSHFKTERARNAWNARYAGIAAGHFSATTGYLDVGLAGKRYCAHRIIWAMVHDDWPENQIDHINGVRTDNRLKNLRAATRSQNMQNISAHKDNASGFKGVSFHKHSQRWQALIQHNRKHHYLGLFSTAEEAHAAYVRAAAKLYGEFANTGT